MCGSDVDFLKIRTFEAERFARAFGERMCPGSFGQALFVIEEFGMIEIRRYPPIPLIEPPRSHTISRSR